MLLLYRNLLQSIIFIIVVVFTIDLPYHIYGQEDYRITEAAITSSGSTSFNDVTTSTPIGNSNNIGDNNNNIIEQQRQDDDQLNNNNNKHEFLNIHSIGNVAEQLSESVYVVQQQNENDDQSKTSSSNKKQKKKKQTNNNKRMKKIPIGTLRPLHLPEPTIFTNWYPGNNRTIQLNVNNHNNNNTNGINLYYATGSVSLPKRMKRNFFNHNNNNNEYNNHQNTNQLDLGDSKQLFQFMNYEHNIIQKRIREEKRNRNNDKKKNYRNTVADVSFSVISNMLYRHEVNHILQLLNEYNQSFFDDDPDTVDSMPTYEIFIDTPWINNPDTNTPKYREITQSKERSILRHKLQQILLPVIHHRIQPFIQYRFPNLCNSTKDRNCIACYSLIRRYKANERISHPPHNDGHAIVTAVTSLSDYNHNYRGGLYVVAPNSLGIRDNNHDNDNINDDDSIMNGTLYGTIPKEHTSISNNIRYVALNAGDTIVHTSALYHGVKVYNKKRQPETTERWSWILWFHDNSDTKCQSDHSKEWYKDCAEREEIEEEEIINKKGKEKNSIKDNNNNDISNDNTIAICQQIYATKVERNEEKFYWNIKSAMNGGSLAAVKIAHFFQYDVNNIQTAIKFYNIAIQYHNDPDAHYGIAQLLLLDIMNITNSNVTNVTKKSSRKNNDIQQQKIKDTLKAVVYHLESAAMGGNVLAMFNLGIAHTYGYGIYDDNKQKYTPIINYTIAVEWFIESGLPEGYYTAAFQAASMNNYILQKQYMERAITLGYGKPWRQTMRQHTGSGRLANVNMNLPWPPSHDGRKPPQF